MTTWAERGKWMDEHFATILPGQHSTWGRCIAVEFTDRPYEGNAKRVLSQSADSVKDAIDAAMAECKRLEDEAKKPEPGLLANTIRLVDGSDTRAMLRAAIKRQCDEWRKMTTEGYPAGSWNDGYNVAYKRCIADLERGL